MEGTDPFMDFFDPFGLGGQLRGRNDGALNRRKDPTRTGSIFAHFEHPMMSFGGMSSLLGANLLNKSDERKTNS